jgi:hypothetical protein
MPLTSHRITKIAIGVSTIAILAATHGCLVASQPIPTAATSSVVLNAIFETGSWLGVMTARAAVSDPVGYRTTGPRAWGVCYVALWNVVDQRLELFVWQGNPALKLLRIETCVGP